MSTRTEANSRPARSARTGSRQVRAELVDHLCPQRGSVGQLVTAGKVQISGRPGPLAPANLQCRASLQHPDVRTSGVQAHEESFEHRTAAQPVEACPSRKCLVLEPRIEGVAQRSRVFVRRH